jgi:hypothetical protein
MLSNIGEIGDPNTIWHHWNDVTVAIGKDCDISFRAGYWFESSLVVAVHLVLAHEPGNTLVIQDVAACLQLQSDSTVGKFASALV